MIQLVRILHNGEPLAAYVPDLYESSFPADERRATEDFMALIDRCPRMEFNAIIDEGEFAGMAVIWNLDTCRYLHYLAVEENKRNKGIGSATLKLLQQLSPLPIIGEVERPNNEMNRRRIAFYERNGFRVISEDPSILNQSHSHSTCILQLISTQALTDIDSCQRRVVDFVYKAYEVDSL